MMTETSALPLIELLEPTRGMLLRRRMLGHKGLIVSVTLLVAIALVALLAPVLSPHDPYAQDLGRRLIPPIWYPKGNWAHVLGTDNLGRDYLSRVLYGARISLLIGVSVMVISGLIGTTLGLVAGYFGGRTDAVVMFVTTVRLAMPLILVALAVVATIGGSLAVVVLVLGLLKWCAGASTPHILLREILPNIASHLAVVATLEIALAILLEAALSFLGLGVPPPLPSWGLMIAEAKSYMFFSFWLIAIPGTALAALVLAINMLGDAIRDVAAPGGRG